MQTPHRKATARIRTRNPLTVRQRWKNSVILFSYATSWPKGTKIENQQMLLIQQYSIETLSHIYKSILFITFQCQCHWLLIQVNKLLYIAGDPRNYFIQMNERKHFSCWVSVSLKLPWIILGFTITSKNESQCFILCPRVGEEQDWYISYEVTDFIKDFHTEYLWFQLKKFQLN